MVKLVWALLLAVGVAVGSVDAAGARPAELSACSFSEGFARFRAALGERIVGECTAGEITDARGNVYQATSHGTLGWVAGTNQIGYRQQTRLWLDGPAGIGSDVTLDGLSDRLTARPSLRAPASTVLRMAALRPGDLGDGWEYAQAPSMPKHRAEAPCGADAEVASFGSLQTMYLNADEQRGVIHTLTALPDTSADGLKGLMERWIAQCREI